jgi:hypothetical protein
MVFALAADAAGQQQWRQLARQAALRGKQVARLPAAAYGGCKDASEAWAAGVLCVGERPEAARQHAGHLEMPEEVREAWAERAAIMMADGSVPRADAERLAWAGLQTLCEASSRPTPCSPQRL